MFSLHQASQLGAYSVSTSEFAKVYPVEVFTDPACYDHPEENLLGYCCTLLQETGAFRLLVDCGELHRSLAVSPHCTILLNQLPDVSHALANPSVTEFTIDFYEQGFVEHFILRKAAGDSVHIRASQTEMVVSRAILRSQFVQFADSFVNAMKIIDGSKVALPVFADWHARVSAPLSETSKMI